MEHIAKKLSDKDTHDKLMTKQGVYSTMPTVVSLLSKDKFDAAGPRVPEGWIFRFLDTISDDAIIQACKGADCLFAPATAGAISLPVLENIPSIKIIQTLGVGFDHVSIPATVRLGIPVANVPGANATSVAEYTIGATIALQRRMMEAHDEIRAGNYLPFRNSLLKTGLKEIRDSKLGLVGFGAIGQQVARIAVMMGASVSYFAPHRRPPEVEDQFGVEYKPFASLLKTSDIVSLHLPLNDQTRGFIGPQELALMPAGSILINTARGEVVQQAALVEALESGHLAGAAIDTFDPEPPGPGNPLLTLSPEAAKRVVLTPHISGATASAFKRMIEAALANMERAVRDEIPENIVNGIGKRK
jgi:phosphoglycerate dehydrogenase-like enzyme